MSRRVMAVFLVPFCILLTGCNRSKVTAQPLAVDFTCTFRAQYKELVAGGTLTRGTAGTLSLDFTQPQTLDGVGADWDGESVKLRYMGVTFKADESAIPESALGEQLVKTFDAALRQEGTREQENGKITVTGTANNAAYTYVYDAQTGHPLSLSVPSLPLTVTFSDVHTQSP